MDEEKLQVWRSRFESIHWERVLKHFDILYTTRSTGTILARCVFHVEKNASLMFYSVRRRYKCYGCGAGGDILDFVLYYRSSEICDEDMENLFYTIQHTPLDDSGQMELFLPNVQVLKL